MTKEPRIPKHGQAAAARAETFWSSHNNVVICLTGGPPCRFGIRASYFLRHSDFGIRHCPTPRSSTFVGERDI